LSGESIDPMRKIAIIGRTNSIDYFRVLGCETFHVETGELDEERLGEILKKRFTLLFVTEDVFDRNKDLIRRNTEGRLPVVSIIPDIGGSDWKEGRPLPRGIAFEELRRAVVRAVGQDISNIEK
jgi:vacuolar-type H+-ATPase subunit F/Vma7